MERREGLAQYAPIKGGYWLLAYYCIHRYLQKMVASQKRKYIDTKKYNKQKQNQT